MGLLRPKVSRRYTSSRLISNGAEESTIVSWRGVLERSEHVRMLTELCE